MNERCKNCGAQLFAGQQFCRACGARTELPTHDDVATQILSGNQPNAPVATMPLAGERTTDPNFGPLPTAPVAAYRPPQQVTPLAASAPAAPRRASLGLMLFALLVIAIGATVIGVGYFVTQQTRTTVRQVVPPVPPALPAIPRPPVPPAAPVLSGDAETLDEDDAEVSDDKTVITKTFPLAPGTGQFELSNLNGDVKIEGWDKPQAEVKITKHGGTPDERAEVEIKLQQTGEHLELRTAPDNQGNIEDVVYEVKLPRRLQHISLSTMNGDVKLAGVEGQIEITAQRGDIKLEDVGGALTTKTLTGNTKVVLAASAPGNAPQSFNAISGNIEVQLGDAMNAEVRADTTSGEIKVDDALGLQVEKRLVGQHLAGRIGQGGPPLVIKTVSGNIKLKQ
jgi:Putative adhesin